MDLCEHSPLVIPYGKANNIQADRETGKDEAEIPDVSRFHEQEDGLAQLCIIPQCVELEVGGRCKDAASGYRGAASADKRRR